MKRVYLVGEGARFLNDDGVIIADPKVLRAAAVALSRFAVNAPHGRVVGDPVHEWVTEGRRTQWEIAHARGDAWAQKTPYSSCGDQGHWLLMCLGVRDERYVNRSGDGGDTPWQIGVNISRLVSLPAYVSAKHANGRKPHPGDIMHVASPDHVNVLHVWNEASAEVETGDYGAPYAVLRKSLIIERGSVMMIGQRVLMGWIDIEALSFDESALVPDAFEYGIADDNPYNAVLNIPAEVP